MQVFNLSSAFERWFDTLSQYSPDERALIRRALHHADPRAGVRAHFALGYRAQLAATSPSAAECFDALVQLPAHVRPMAFIPLQQNLVATIVMAALHHSTDHLANDLRRIGALNTRTFMASSSGQALFKAAEGQITHFSEHFNTLLGHIYNRGGGLLEQLDGQRARMVIDDTGCPPVQHLTWRGAIEALSQQWVPHHLDVTSATIDERAFMLEITWYEAPQPTPPVDDATTPDALHAWSPSPSATQESSTQLQKVRTRSGEYRSLSSLTSSLPDERSNDSVALYTLSDALILWLQHDLAEYATAERALVLESIDAIDVSDGIRAFVPLAHRALLSPEEHSRFRTLIGELPSRQMDFVPLKQALAAVLFTGVAQQQATPSLFEIIVEMGRHSGRAFATASTGRALLSALDHEFPLVIRQCHRLVSTLINHGQARVEVLEDGHSVIVLSKMRSPELQHLWWRGLIEGVAATMGVQITHSKSAVQDEHTFFLELRWHNPPQAP